uniref:Uncharacterized protein n=1 Tax=Amphimedon queenslandica TaxID=400682 RepID=A0A1X7UKY5_AMPQE
RDSICINDVENSLKSCNKIYYLKRNEKEVRVSDYNPLLLKLWHANLDLQYIEVRSLSLTEYVTGYVTKAERVMHRTYGMKSAAGTTYTADYIKLAKIYFELKK